MFTEIILHLFTAGIGTLFGIVYMIRVSNKINKNDLYIEIREYCKKIGRYESATIPDYHFEIHIYNKRKYASKQMKVLIENYQYFDGKSGSSKENAKIRKSLCDAVEKESA